GLAPLRGPGQVAAAPHRAVVADDEYILHRHVGRVAAGGHGTEIQPEPRRTHERHVALSHAVLHAVAEHRELGREPGVVAGEYRPLADRLQDRRLRRRGAHPGHRFRPDAGVAALVAVTAPLATAVDAGRDV